MTYAKFIVCYNLCSTSWLSNGFGLLIKVMLFAINSISANICCYLSLSLFLCWTTTQALRERNVSMAFWIIYVSLGIPHIGAKWDNFFFLFFFTSIFTQTEIQYLYTLFSQTMTPNIQRNRSHYHARCLHWINTPIYTTI